MCPKATFAYWLHLPDGYICQVATVALRLHTLIMTEFLCCFQHCYFPEPFGCTSHCFKQEAIWLHIEDSCLSFLFLISMQLQLTDVHATCTWQQLVNNNDCILAWLQATFL